jgi:transcription elongation factor GreA
MSPIPLTVAGAEKLRAELHEMKTVQRPAVIAAIAEARSHGDLSENAEYHQAREEQAEVEARIGRIENILKNSVMIGESGSDVITIGSTFRLQKGGDNKSYIYTLVGSEEADMSIGKISNQSPLGLVLVGHKKGDTVEVNAPKGKLKYTVEDIIK